MTPTFRLALPRDAVTLAAFAERVFRDTFSAQNTRSDMDAYCAGAFGAVVQRGEIEDPAHLTLLCAQDGNLIAYAQLVESPPPDGVSSDRAVELKRFYLAPDQHGSGLAAALMEHTLAHARGRRYETVWLGVWEKNERAIRFYRKMRFEPVGEHDFMLGSDRQRDLIMARVLDVPRRSHLGGHMIRGLHAMFYSSEAAELRTFLRDKLGLSGSDVGGGWLIFEPPEADLGVHPTEGEAVASGTADISFYCDDIHATVRELRGRGVEFVDDIADHGYGFVTHFKVPGGFNVQLYQPKYQK